MVFSYGVLHSNQCSKHFVRDVNALFSREPGLPSTNFKMKRIRIFGLCVALLLEIFLRP